MSNYVQECYNPVQIGVNATVLNTSNGLGGFLAVTAGTITITTQDATPRTVIPTLTVAAGAYYPMPFRGTNEGLKIVTAGGASGVLGVH